MFKPQAFFHCFILAIFIIIFLCAQIYDVVDTLVFCKRHGTGKVQDSDGHHITYDVSSSLSSVLMTNIMWCKFCTKKKYILSSRCPTWISIHDESDEEAENQLHEDYDLF